MKPDYTIVHTMKATIGRIVHYVLTEQDADEINRRRTTGGQIQEALAEGTWPRGAQVHIGNPAKAGQHLPAVITEVWDQTSGCSNLSVILDGNDNFWATSIDEDDNKTEGSWHWPEYDPS